jgi:Uma2 family endonuclease
VTTQPKLSRLTADEFLAWALEQPRGRFELAGGEVVAMAPERVEHARAKLAATLALRTGLLAGGLPCEAIIDGVAVRIDDLTVYEPDVIVRCGERAPGTAIEVADPVVLVEVVSPSSRAIDSGAKLTDYFRLPSVRHYLVVNIDARAVAHHRRDEAGEIATLILRDGELVLDPPGMTVAVEEFFSTL